MLVVLTGALCYLFLGGQSKDCVDADGDGYFVSTCGSVCAPLDCDDANPDIHPGMSEGPEGDPACADGLDNDCDGLTDGGDPGCSGALGPLPDTGVELCYDNSNVIECPAPGEPFYGQDANYATNPMNYTDNGNDTVKDHVTGLTWEQRNSETTWSWDDAVSYCDRLDLADHEDWRLPDIKELYSIVDFTLFDPAVDESFFPGPYGENFWSSTTPSWFAEERVWVVDMTGGNFAVADKSIGDMESTRCVRD